jgi:DNA segregation ATPase FtsK/SpoIIIE-like protein
MIRRGPIVTLGLGLQDDPKRINFKEASMAHVLISGQTRSGKTNTQRLIGWNIARNTDPNEAQLIIFDVAKRGYKWRDFSRVAHLAHPVVIDLDEADRVLAWLVSEIERRAEQRYTQPRLFCLIDELKALTDDSKVAASYLARIASVGGEFGLHLVLATQYPQVKMLGSAELKRNVTTRLCGKVDDANAAANALGLPGSGAETLQGYGDFLLRDFNGLSRLTVARIENRHINDLPRADEKCLDLPPTDVANKGISTVPSSNQPECLTPQEIAPVLFQWGDRPTGINKIQSQAGGVGSKKARRIQHFVMDLIRLAQANGVETINFNQLKVDG